MTTTKQQNDRFMGLADLFALFAQFDKPLSQTSLTNDIKIHFLPFLPSLTNHYHKPVYLLQIINVKELFAMPKFCSVNSFFILSSQPALWQLIFTSPHHLHCQKYVIEKNWSTMAKPFLTSQL
jgi:hypothetical protein